MSVLTLVGEGNSVRFDEAECERVGSELSLRYGAADPYPHIMLDDFIDTSVLRRVVDEFPSRRSGRFSDEHSDLKTGYKLEMIDSPYIRNLFAAFNSSPFLRFLEQLTGIAPLLPDPHFSGGGLHEVARNGFLKLHADFNQHPEFDLSRRLNLIVFLNDDWPAEYGGALELWNRGVDECRQRIEPLLGRAVIFNTTETSWHGHPDPLTCPTDRFRRSMALYYFSTLGSDEPARRTTNFVARPGTGESESSQPKRWRRIVSDWCPPAIQRRLR